ncbi:MAG: GDP-mannose dehydrogenase, partial [Candidatus Binatia bacterium]
MRISVFGMGYVGAVSAACFARDGHAVVGVDPNGTKIDIINQGQSPIIENGLGELIAQAVAAGRLKAVPDAAQAVNGTELSLICVGTPSQS